MIQSITEPSDEPEALGSTETVLVTVGAATVEVTVAVWVCVTTGAGAERRRSGERWSGRASQL